MLLLVISGLSALENVLTDNPLFCCRILLKGCHFPFFSIGGNKYGTKSN